MKTLYFVMKSLKRRLCKHQHTEMETLQDFRCLTACSSAVPEPELEPSFLLASPSPSQAPKQRSRNTSKPTAGAGAEEKQPQRLQVPFSPTQCAIYLLTCWSLLPTLWGAAVIPYPVLKLCRNHEVYGAEAKPHLHFSPYRASTSINSFFYWKEGKVFNVCQ